MTAWTYPWPRALSYAPSDFQCSVWSNVSSFGFPHDLEVLLQLVPWKFLEVLSQMLTQNLISCSLGHCRVFSSTITKLCWLRQKTNFSAQFELAVILSQVLLQSES